MNILSFSGNTDEKTHRMRCKIIRMIFKMQSKNINDIFYLSDFQNFTFTAFQPTFPFYMETKHLIGTANQITGFNKKMPNWTEIHLFVQHYQDNNTKKLLNYSNTQKGLSFMYNSIARLVLITKLVHKNVMLSSS